jgi:hypothetical protein
MYRRTRIGAAVSFLALSLTACAAPSNGAAPSASPSAPPSSGSTAGNTPAAIPSNTDSPTLNLTGTPPAAVTVGEKGNGSTVTLVTGQRLRIVLASTYWQLQDSSDLGVLRAEGQPRINPQPTECVPGAGCGTASATYLAVSPGQADVKATRTSCGEAMACTGTEGLFTLHVIVH